jgi:Domain of unknown function (DUF4136)
MQSRQGLRLTNLIIILIAGYVLSGCSSSKANIIADHDSSAPFGSYNTWNFFENAGPDYEGYQSFFTQYMMTAITIEMEKRGYTKSDNPDLLVNFNAMLQDKTKVSTTPSTSMHAGYGGGYGGGYYGYRGSSYGAWGGYGYGTETRVSQYTEGTFNIDIVDAKQQQLVWEAVGVGKVTEKVLENLEEGVMNGVPRFFSLYPYVAGNPDPVTAE